MRTKRELAEMAIRCAALAMGISHSLIRMRKRTVDIAFTRQMAMTLVYETADVSASETGRLFGKHHGTVCHAYKVVKLNVARAREWIDAQERFKLALSNHGQAPALSGKWRHADGILWCDNVRVAGMAFEDEPDFGVRVFDDICAAMNGRTT